MELVNKAIELHPNSASAYSLRARLFRDAGQPADGLRDLSMAEKLDPKDYWISYDKGRTLLSMKRKDEALVAFDRASELNRDEFVAYIYSAGIKTEKEDFAGAERDYTALTRLNPDYYYAFEGLGMLQMRKKEYQAARDSFLAAYSKAPTETGYVILAMLNALRVQNRIEVKPFIETTMRTVKRESLDYSMLRLLYEFSGDVEMGRKIQNEKNVEIKGKMAFYLAEYYDITNKAALAVNFYEMCKELNRRSTIEWRLNEWIMAERNLARAPTR
jgi:tetratricopeptide (TPR) repeat protein